MITCLYCLKQRSSPRPEFLQFKAKLVKKYVIWLFLMAALSLISSEASAAIVCVGVSNTGTYHDGRDWNNQIAWSSVNFVRGNTYYVADGTYTSKTFSTAANNGTTIVIKKATVGNPEVESIAGWNSSYGSTQAFFSPLRFQTSDWVFDGAKGPLWSTALTDYGFQIVNSKSSPNGIEIYADTYADSPNSSTRALAKKLSNITISHVASSAVVAADYERYFICGNDSSLGSDTVTVSHCYGNEYENFIKISAVGGTRQNGWLTEYNVFTNVFSNGDYHGEDLNTAFEDVTNWTIRYNWIEGQSSVGSQPTGAIVVLNGPSTGPIKIYGNIFINKPISFGLVGGVHYPMHGVFYNNTIVNCNAPPEYGYSRWVIGVDGGNDMTVQNNLIANSYCDRGGSGTISHNSYYNCSKAPASETGMETIAIGNNPFISVAAKNLRLAARTAAGVPISSNAEDTFNKDAFGNLRTTWSRGAFEYSGEASPQPPSNLQVR